MGEKRHVGKEEVQVQEQDKNKAEIGREVRRSRTTRAGDEEEERSRCVRVKVVGAWPSPQQ